MGRFTTSVYAGYQDDTIHGKVISEVPLVVKQAQAREAKERLLWLGNSQLHGVNQYTTGEQNMVAHLASLLHPVQKDLIAFSQPNAHLGEHLVYFEYVTRLIPIHTRILPVVFDDFRNIKIRPAIQTAMKQTDVTAALNQTKMGRRILKQQTARTSGSGVDEFAGLKDTLQERSERMLNRFSNRYLPLWKTRKEARGAFFLFLYRLRNTVFNITAQSKRRKIKSRYNYNLKALRTILQRAKQKTIRVLVYIAPIRNDVALPYSKQEYETFKQEIERICRTNGARFVNLEAVIPNEYWGRKASTGANGQEGELDFMHVQAAGHKKMAAVLAEIVNNNDF